MNTDLIKGNWKQLKGKVRQQWGALSQNDLDKIEGSYDELAGLLEQTYGYSKDKVKKEISTLLNNANLGEIKEKANNIADSLSQGFSNAKDQVEDTISRTVGNLKEKSTHTHEQAISYIRENPAKSVGIALLAGMFIQYLFRK